MPAGDGRSALDRDQALSRIRAELDAVRSSVESIERELSTLEGGVPPAPTRPRPARYWQLLIEIYERGPHGISTAELDQLAGRYGYDRRGLNGYFAGARAPLCTDGSRIRLTVAGQHLVHEQLRQETGA